MATLLPKTAAACPKKATATALPVGLIITIITFLLHTIGPAALPMIETWVATLNLPPAVVAEIDQILESILKAQAPSVP